MFIVSGKTAAIKTTSYKVVLPFYVYAAVSFLVATFFLFFNSGTFLNHYFHPHTLAITHIMALGWGTMIILGASHQLVSVIIEGKLYSEKLAMASFICAAIGIPLLVYGFYYFKMGAPAKWGGRFVLVAIILYLINLWKSISQSKSENVQAIFVFTSVLWLFVTAALGLALVYNFTYIMFPKGSLHYLPLHVHAGVIGWFLLLILGVGSRLIPMFLISKYQNIKLLWYIYFLINSGLVGYILLFYTSSLEVLLFIPIAFILIAIALFIYYCYCAYKQRIRKQVDDQMKISLLSIGMILLPIILISIIIVMLMSFSINKTNLVLSYGFLIFFGWITAIILGMTFKTLPFIVWNKVYHTRSAVGKTPTPKDLFSAPVFKWMGIFYIAGFIAFVLGITFSILILIQIGAILLIISAALYNTNVFKLITHKANNNE